MDFFEQGLAEDAPPAEPAEAMLTEPAMDDGRAAGTSASLCVDVTGNAALTFSSGGAGAEASSSSGGASGDSATGIKRPQQGPRMAPHEHHQRQGRRQAARQPALLRSPRPRLLERDPQARCHGQGERAQQKRHLPSELEACRRCRHRWDLAASPQRRPAARLQPLALA